MPRVNHRSLAKLPEALLALHEATTLETLAPAVLEAMRILVQAEIYTIDAYDRRKMHCLTISWPQVITGIDINILHAHFAEHPNLSSAIDPDRWPVMRWSDYTTLRQFRQTALYHDFFRHSGTNQQMVTVFQLDKDTNFHAVFNRHRGHFTEDERGLMQLVLPHFKQAYRQARARSELDRLLALQQLFESNTARLLLTEDGSVLLANDPARKLCRDFFGSDVEHKAPGLLLDWIANRLPSEKQFVQTCGTRRLVIECGDPAVLPPELTLVQKPVAERSYGLLLHLIERSPSAPAKSLQILGLTPREAEVLFWMAQGKRDGEIAIILTARPRTIGKHVEHIFAKLNLETRTAAVSLACEVLFSGS